MVGLRPPRRGRGHDRRPQPPTSRTAPIRNSRFPWAPVMGESTRPSRSRPASAADSAGDSRRADGETLGPGDGPAPAPDIAAHSVLRGAETDLGRPGWTQSLAGHHWPQSARHTGPTRHSTWRTCRLLRATDSDGTCWPPASTHRGSARPDKAVTSDKMFPAMTLPWGPAQHPSAKTLARPGHRPGPSKYFTAAAAGSSRLQHHHNPRAEATATRMPLRKKDHPPQIASSLAPPTRTSNDERDIGPRFLNPTHFDAPRSYPSPTLALASVHST